MARRREPSLDLSPSLNHRDWMRKNPPSLAYDGGDVKAWQRKLRRKLRDALGWKPTEKPPLEPRRLWKRDHPLGTIEKIVFTAEPKADVPAYLCLPRDVKPPYPVFVCVQGHSTGMHNSIAVDREDNAKPIKVEGDRDFGLGCMRRGIAALCIEQRSFGERREQVIQSGMDYLCHHAAMHALMLGRTLVGERVYDVDRAIDYLATRDDMDLGKLGIMGNSGGGTVSLFAAATLPRLRYAMPSCYFCTFADSIMSIFHCLCNYVPGLLQYAEMADVMGLFAPKPVVIVNGKKDDIFPIGAAKKEFRRLKAIYKALGAETQCRHVIGAEGHRFYADDAWPVMKKLMGIA